MKKICCIGDSNTYGYDPRDPLEMRYPEETRWTGRIRTENRVVINMGMNGLRIPRAPVFSHIPEWIGKYGPVDAIVVMLGSNDLLERSRAEETAERMRSFLRKLLEGHKPDTILLVAPPVFQPGEWVEGENMIAESRKLAGSYRRLAEELEIRFANAGEWGIEVVYDGVHFSSDGHHTFAAHLDKLLP